MNESEFEAVCDCEAYDCHGECCGPGQCTCSVLAEPESNYCGDCGRLIGVGCACGLSFKDKIRTVRVDRSSLRVRDTGA